MRTSAVLAETTLTPRRLEWLTRDLWPHKMTGSGCPREYDARERAVLGFVAVLGCSPLYPEGVPLKVARVIDRQVVTGDELTLDLTGPGWSFTVSR